MDPSCIISTIDKLLSNKRDLTAIDLIPWKLLVDVIFREGFIAGDVNRNLKFDPLKLLTQLMIC